MSNKLFIRNTTQLISEHGFAYILWTLLTSYEMRKKTIRQGYPKSDILPSSLKLVFNMLLKWRYFLNPSRIIILNAQATEKLKNVGQKHYFSFFPRQRHLNYNRKTDVQHNMSDLTKVNNFSLSESKIKLATNFWVS